MDNLPRPPRAYACGCTSPATTCQGCKPTTRPAGATSCACLSHVHAPGQLGGAPRGTGGPGPMGDAFGGAPYRSGR